MAPAAERTHCPDPLTPVAGAGSGAPRGWRRAVLRVADRYGPEALPSDPLRFPRRFADPADREVAAFLAAGLAFGNANSVGASLERVFDWTGPHPARFASRLRPVPGAGPAGFRHRWIDGLDVLRLATILGRIRERHGSLEALFASGIAVRRGVPDLRASLMAFRESALALEPGELAVPPTRSAPGVRYFFPSPLTSAAKRPLMFLRWMIRPDDGLDLGLWDCLAPRHLVVPLDTHMFRIARRLRLTRRKTPGWLAAVDLTRALARLEPDDPARFDFPLSRLGIVEGCPGHARSAPCELCRLLRGERQPARGRGGFDGGAAGPGPARRLRRSESPAVGEHPERPAPRGIHGRIGGKGNPGRGRQRGETLSAPGCGRTLPPLYRTVTRERSARVPWARSTATMAFM